MSETAAVREDADGDALLLRCPALGLDLYPEERRCWRYHRNLDLEPTEARLLQLLMVAPRRPWTQRELACALGVELGTVDGWALGLREKLYDPEHPSPVPVRTVPGAGYALLPPVLTTTAQPPLSA